MKTGTLLGLLAVAAYALFILLYRAFWMLDGISSQRHTSAFLAQVKSRQFHSAERLLDHSVNRPGWEERMTKLSESGFRLAAYNRVKAEYHDGSYSTGHADLTWIQAGKPLQTEAILTFGFGNKPKQICVITPPGIKRGSIPELEEWNRLFCGGSF